MSGFGESCVTDIQIYKNHWNGKKWILQEKTNPSLFRAWSTFNICTKFHEKVTSGFSPVSNKHPVQNHLPRGFDGFSMFTKFKTLILLDQFLWRPGHFLELTLFDPPYFRTKVKFWRDFFSSKACQVGNEMKARFKRNLNQALW